MVLPNESFQQTNQHILLDLPFELRIGCQSSECIVLYCQISPSFPGKFVILVAHCEPTKSGMKD